MYLLFSVPFMWAIDKFGIRGSTGVSVWLLLISNGIRCFANDAQLLSVVLVHVSFILNSIAGPPAAVFFVASFFSSPLFHIHACTHSIHMYHHVYQTMPSKLAESWFAPAERTTATAIASLGNQGGGFFLLIIIPFICPDDASTSLADAVAGQFRLNLVLTVASALNVCMFFIYFPSRPNVAPSLSAGSAQNQEAQVRVYLICFVIAAALFVFHDFVCLVPQISLVSLLRDGYTLLFNIPFLLVLLTNGLINGFSNDAAALLTNNLGNLDNNSQSVAGWVGAIGNGLGLIVGVS